MKKIIRLTENDLHKVVKNSVNRVLKEAMTSSTYHLNRMYGSQGKPDMRKNANEVLKELVEKYGEREVLFTLVSHLDSSAYYMAVKKSQLMLDADNPQTSNSNVSADYQKPNYETPQYETPNYNK